MNNRALAMAVLALFGALWACSDADEAPTTAPQTPLTPTASSPTVVTDPPLIKTIEQLIGELGAAGAPGGAIMAIRDGQVVFQRGYGVAQLGGEALTPDHAFHLASAGKQFTALGIMMLAEEGSLNYDDAIGQHFPELDWMGDDVTIRRLLQHTSGLPDYYEDDALSDALLAINDTPTNADVVAVLAETDELVAEPGDEFSYNNTGYDLLGALIEHLSGQTYAEFMQTRLFDPVGMTGAFALPSTRSDDPRTCLSYTDDHGAWIAQEPDDLDGLSGAGSIYVTLNDLAKYDAALYTNQLIRAASLAEARKPALLNSGEEYPYGFAWDIGDVEGHPYMGHSGSWYHFATYFLRLPEDHVSVVVLLNQDAGPDPEELAFEIAKEVLK